MQCSPEAAMIELVLEIRDAADEMAIRDLVGRREGITLIGPGGQGLDEGFDVDTLLMEDWPAVDFYAGRPPRQLGWVVVDAKENIRCLVYEAAIAPVGSEYGRPITTHATWIVSLSHYASPTAASDRGPHAVHDAERGRQFIPGELADYPRFLNAFEVMERHNAAGKLPSIQRVGIWAIPGWMSGLLRAYEVYRERALAGAYGHPDGGSDS